MSSFKRFYEDILFMIWGFRGKEGETTGFQLLLMQFLHRQKSMLMTLLTLCRQLIAHRFTGSDVKVLPTAYTTSVSEALQSALMH